MKKFLILLLCLFATDSFASGISGGTTTAPCDNATLSKYTGTANVEINWEPNVINLKWYDGDTEINVANASQTCTYDGMITVPPQPTKPGYTFNGWKIAKYDFSTLPVNASGIHAWSKNAPGYDCWYGSGQTFQTPCDNGDFDDLDYNEWKVSFNYGMVYGVAKCSSTVSETTGEIKTPAEQTGSYCYCRATGFIPTNSTLKYIPTRTLNWAFVKPLNGVDGCNAQCADYCSAWLTFKTNLRQSLYN